MNSFRFAAAAFALVGLIAGGTPALANTLTFFDTGVAANGSVLAAGSTDSHYTLLYSSDGGSYTATTTTPNGAWAGDTSTAGWISPGASGNSSWNSGYYIYETTLDLTGYNASTASLSGMIAGDDFYYIYLNRGGNAVFSGSGFSSLTPFLVNSGFVSGINQVDFVVVNQGSATGLMVDGAVLTADSQTPEPGTLMLLGTGVALGVFGRMRRRRAMLRFAWVH